MKRTPCSCGRPFALIDGIEGRTEDVLSFPTAAGKETAINPLVFHCIMDIVPASGWQIVQEESGMRVLLSEVREGFAEGTLIDALWQALQAQGGHRTAHTGAAGGNHPPRYNRQGAFDQVHSLLYHTVATYGSFLFCRLRTALFSTRSIPFRYHVALKKRADFHSQV